LQGAEGRVDGVSCLSAAAADGTSRRGVLALESLGGWAVVLVVRVCVGVGGVVLCRCVCV